MRGWKFIATLEIYSAELVTLGAWAAGRSRDATGQNGPVCIKVVGSAPQRCPFFPSSDAEADACRSEHSCPFLDVPHAYLARK